MSSSVASGASTLSSSALMRMNPLAGQKAKKEIEKRRGDVKTYTVPVIFAGETDRKIFYQSYHKKFSNSKKTAIYRLQVLRKYPTTVGKFYHELVEHSGKVTPEDFWQRYDYRCCDVSRVMGELQAAKEAGKKRKSQQQRLKQINKSKESAHVKKYKDEAKKTASMSWMSIMSSATTSLKSSKKKVQESSTVAIETAGTVDTADEEYHLHETDHVKDFKRSIGGASELLDASPSETAKAVQEDDSLEGPTGLASIFRNVKTTEGKDDSENKIQDSLSLGEEEGSNGSSPPLKLVAIWLLYALLASMSLDPQRWMTQQFGNKLCAPIRPGSMLDTSEEEGTFVAPWWAPAVMKNSLFGHLCAVDAEGNPRKHAQITTKLWPNMLLHRNEQHLSVEIIALNDNRNREMLVKIPRVMSFELDSTGSKILVEDLGGNKEYDAPWALQ